MVGNAGLRASAPGWRDVDNFPGPSGVRKTADLEIRVPRRPQTVLAMHLDSGNRPTCDSFRRDRCDDLQSTGQRFYRCLRADCDLVVADNRSRWTTFPARNLAAGTLSAAVKRQLCDHRADAVQGFAFADGFRTKRPIHCIDHRLCVLGLCNLLHVLLGTRSAVGVLAA